MVWVCRVCAAGGLCRKRPNRAACVAGLNGLLRVTQRITHCGARAAPFNVTPRAPPCRCRARGACHIVVTPACLLLAASLTCLHAGVGPLPRQHLPQAHAERPYVCTGREGGEGQRVHAVQDRKPKRQEERAFPGAKCNEDGSTVRCWVAHIGACSVSVAVHRYEATEAPTPCALPVAWLTLPRNAS